MKRIIFTGKGGVGKTTILSNLVRLLARDQYRVLAIDCDPSMNLAMSLGIPLTQILSLAEDKTRFQESLESGRRSHVHPGAEDEDDEDDDHYGGDDHDHGMIEPDNATLNEYILKSADGVNLMVMGTIPFGGAGCLCAPIALVKLLVNYLMSNPAEYDFIFVDSQAGVEIFGRGLASEFDLALVITEPTPKSMEVAKHGSQLARDLGVKRQVAVINKVECEEDVQFANRELAGMVDLVVSMGYDLAVKEADKSGELLLDYAPNAPVFQSIQLVKRCVLGEI